MAAENSQKRLFLEETKKLSSLRLKRLLGMFYTSGKGKKNQSKVLQILVFTLTPAVILVIY